MRTPQMGQPLLFCPQEAPPAWERVRKSRHPWTDSASSDDLLRFVSACLALYCAFGPPPSRQNPLESRSTQDFTAILAFALANRGLFTAVPRDAGTIDKAYIGFYNDIRRSGPLSISRHLTGPQLIGKPTVYGRI